MRAAQNGKYAKQKKGYEKPRGRTTHARLPAKVSVPPFQKYHFDSTVCTHVVVGGRPGKSRTVISVVSWTSSWRRTLYTIMLSSYHLLSLSLSPFGPSCVLLLILLSLLHVVLFLVWCDGAVSFMQNSLISQPRVLQCYVLF